MTFKLDENKRRMLTRIAQQPRRLSFFTHKDIGLPLHPDVIKGWLDKMIEAGLIFEAESNYHITVLGRQRLDAKDVATMRQTVGRHVTYKSGMCDPQPTYYRPGADHSHIKSRGFSC